MLLPEPQLLSSCGSSISGSTYQAQMLPYEPMASVPPKSLWHRFKRIVYFVQFLFKSIPVVVKLIIGWLWPPPPKSIAGWTALVTGGANGIGRAVALELAKYGCNVIIADLDAINGEKTARALRKYRVKAAAYEVDIAVYEQVVELKRQVEQDFGHVDILVNNAAVLPFLVPDEYAPENLQRMVDVNILGFFWTTDVFLPGMYARRRGHVVGLSSQSAYITLGFVRDYVTTKYANRGFMEELHDEIYHAGYEGQVVTTSVFPDTTSTRREPIEHILSLPGAPVKAIQLPEEVGRVIVEAIRNNKRKVRIPELIRTWQLALLEDLPKPITRLLISELSKP